MCDRCKIKSAPINGLADEAPLICGGCTKIEWGGHVVPGKGVPNMYYDRNSSEPHRIEPYLPLDVSKERLRGLPYALMFRHPGLPLAEFEKILPLLEAKHGKRKSRAKRNNDAIADERDNAIEAAGDMEDLSKEEMKASSKEIVTIFNECCEPGDLFSIMKVSVQPVPGGRNIVLNNEAQRKYRSPRVATLLTNEGRVPPLGTGPGEIMVVEVDSIEEIHKLRKLQESKDGPEMIFAYKQVSRETTLASARVLEEKGQDKMIRHDIPNHTEDDHYHPGGSGDPAAVAVGLGIGALKSVRYGSFYLNNDLPKYLTSRIRTKYSWARDNDTFWRDEASGARQQYLAYQNAHEKAKRSKKSSA